MKQVMIMLAVLVLAGCAALGLEATSFDQKLSLAEGADTATLTAATASLRAGEISAADLQQVITLADQAKALIDSARVLETSDPSAASAKYQLANSVLVQLQTYLNSRKKGK